ARARLACADPDPWGRYHNPAELLINVEPQHWLRLLADPEFVEAYQSVIAALDAYRARERRWARHPDAVLCPGAFARARALLGAPPRRVPRAGRLLLDGVRPARVAGRVLGRPGRAGRRP